MVRSQPSVGSLTWMLAGVAGLVHATLALITYASFSNGYDLAIFDQAVRHYARFEAPISMMLGQDANLLGEHFSPILAVFAPLYWVWDDPRMLLLGQSAVLALSVPVVVRFARRHVSDRVALAIGLGYALGWPLQGLSGFDVHEIVFGVLFLGLALDALDRHDDRWLAIWSLALLTVREDMGLVIVVLGMLRLLRAGRRWWGLMLMGGGLIGYVVVTSVAIPALSSTGSWRFWSYDALGPDLPSSLTSIVTSPVGAATLFVTPGEKAATLVLLFLPVGLLALRSPYVLIAAPLLAARFWSSRESLWQPYYHYNSIVWIVLVLAAVHAISSWSASRRAGVGQALAAVVVAFALIGTLVLPSVFPLGRVVRPADGATAAAANSRAAIVEHVPAGTCVAGDHATVAHLLTTNVVGHPTRWERDPDFLVLDRNPSWPVRLWVIDSQLTWANLRAYAPVKTTEHFVLMRNAEYLGPSAACIP